MRCVDVGDGRAHQSVNGVGYSGAVLAEDDFHILRLVIHIHDGGEADMAGGEDFALVPAASRDELLREVCNFYGPRDALGTSPPVRQEVLRKRNVGLRGFAAVACGIRGHDRSSICSMRSAMAARFETSRHFATSRWV